MSIQRLSINAPFLEGGGIKFYTIFNCYFRGWSEQEGRRIYARHLHAVELFAEPPLADHNDNEGKLILSTISNNFVKGLVARQNDSFLSFIPANNNPSDYWEIIIRDHERIITSYKVTPKSFQNILLKMIVRSAQDEEYDQIQLHFFFNKTGIVEVGSSLQSYCHNYQSSHQRYVSRSGLLDPILDKLKPLGELLTGRSESV